MNTNRTSVRSCLLIVTLFSTFAHAIASGSPGVDTSDKQAVRQFYLDDYLSSNGVSMGWTGDRGACDAGTTSAAFKKAVLDRINYFRSMAGVPNISGFDNTYNQKAQKAALMMSVNGQLSHTPPTTWDCFTADGEEAAGSSNLGLGSSGPGIISGYIRDSGTNNYPVGHRRWILYPQTKFMGTGDLPASGGWAANALWVFDDNIWSDRPATRDGFVAWPPVGFVPRQVIYPRWSFSYPGADFSGATISVSRDGAPVSITISPIVNGYGENTIVWEMGETLPVGEFQYSVEINGAVIGGGTQDFNYVVNVFDPTDQSSNQAPQVSIAGGNRTIADTDGTAGEPVTFSGTATDADGSISSTEWLVGGTVVATGLNPTIVLPDGSTTVTLRATDNDGATATASVVVTVQAATLPNQAPQVSIAGGNRTIADTDGAAGEPVSFSGTATDTDGSISSTAWWINGAVVAIGLSPTIALPDGSTTVTLRATDNDGATATASVVVTVQAAALPNQAPQVSIAGGNRTIADTDGAAGEPVAFSGTAMDSDGSIVDTAWLINGAVVATGLSPTIALPDGSTTVTLRATDNDGATVTASVVVTVQAAALPNQAPQVSIAVKNNIADSDDSAGEPVTFSGTATDADGSISSTEWLVGGTVVATGLNPTIVLPDGSSTVTLRAIDNDGATAIASVLVTVNSPADDSIWLAPFSGVTPAPDLELEFNNIGVYEAANELIYSCVRILDSGETSDMDGIQQFEIAFEILSASDGLIRLFDYRPFNESSALNERGELPDCSGAFEKSTGMYTDLLAYFSETFAITFRIFDGVDLIFELQSLEAIVP